MALGGGSVLSLIRTGRLRRVRITRLQMGTFVTITAVHPRASRARELVEAGFTEMERLEAILSRHRPTTPVARLNREGRVDRVPHELIQVVETAREVSEASGGAFDVTVAPLLNLMASRAAAGRSPPSHAEIESVLKLVNFRDLDLDGGVLRFRRPGMALTLDGVAKGYIVDRTLDALVAAGAERALVDGGGDMASTGTPAPGESWQVAVRDPRDHLGSLGVVHLEGSAQGVATSGDYVQSFTPDRSVHHILDPRTGRSPGEVSGVTVRASSALKADVLSTTAFVLGPREGKSFLESWGGVEGILVTKEGEEWATDGFLVRRS